MDLKSTDHLLTTTRSVRKRLDLTRAVEPEIIEECLDIAIQAPTSSNSQGWHFFVITDAEKRANVAALYKQSYDSYVGGPAPTSEDEDPMMAQMRRVRSSSRHLADHMHEVPVLIIACVKGRPDNPSPAAQASMYGSILPAAWSLMLALRSRGLGSAWTTLHLPHEQEVAELLGIPDDISQAVLLPVAYFTGEDFKPAKRLPARELTHWNSWGNRRS